RVGGQFLIRIAGFTETSFTFAGFQIGYLEFMMTVLLVGVATYTILGGMLSVLITDFLQFVVMSIGLIVVTVLILVYIGWDTLVATVETNYGAGGFNPFANPELGWQYVLFQALLNFAAVL